MKHHEKAKLLQDEYYRLIHIRPIYPRSRVELEKLRKEIDDIKKAKREIAIRRAEREREVINDDYDDDDPTLSYILSLKWKMQNWLLVKTPTGESNHGKAKNSLTR